MGIPIMNEESITFSSLTLYQSDNGNIQLDVQLKDETVWLSLNQLATLFNRDKSVISRHMKNIFSSQELDAKSTVAFFATVQKEGEREITREIEYFNLDVIIAVGYRVNSKEGTQFRQWATEVLKEHLIKGFTYHQHRLQEKGLAELQQTIKLLEKTLVQQQLVSDIGIEVIKLIGDYAKTWHLLLAYDEDKLTLPTENHSSQPLVYIQVKESIESLKIALTQRQESSDLFGRERENSLSSILANLEQTFDNAPLYHSSKEKAANLLYFVIKDHPFVDGNKRIGSFLFLLYLEMQPLPNRIDDKCLVALALLVAESHPNQKDLLIRLIVNLLSE